ncbi:hypothetical protein BGZ63DRAFT_65351 [Mariannaea sp. PMI_226]|nr:hypothetical protein BGZ63DRAFT_65351 [Mariannaea sp. PMI_226]
MLVEVSVSIFRCLSVVITTAIVLSILHLFLVSLPSCSYILVLHRSCLFLLSISLIRTVLRGLFSRLGCLE